MYTLYFMASRTTRSTRPLLREQSFHLGSESCSNGGAKR
jgi:hypothetical protein